MGCECSIVVKPRAAAHKLCGHAFSLSASLLLAFGGAANYCQRVMAQIKPFAALRPRPLLANKICEPPYDVMSSAEARLMARGNTLSFLHVSKPEIDLPENTDLYDA